MKTKRNKLEAKTALPSKPKAEAPMVPNVAPEAAEDEDQLVRTSEAAHRLGVSENSIRKYMAQGLLDRVLIGTRTVRTTRRSLSRLMGMQAAE